VPSEDSSMVSDRLAMAGDIRDVDGAETMAAAMDGRGMAGLRGVGSKAMLGAPAPWRKARAAQWIRA